MEILSTFYYCLIPGKGRVGGAPRGMFQVVAQPVGSPILARSAFDVGQVRRTHFADQRSRRVYERQSFLYFLVTQSVTETHTKQMWIQHSTLDGKKFSTLQLTLTVVTVEQRWQALSYTLNSSHAKTAVCQHPNTSVFNNYYNIAYHSNNDIDNQLVRSRIQVTENKQRLNIWVNRSQ